MDHPLHPQSCHLQHPQLNHLHWIQSCHPHHPQLLHLQQWLLQTLELQFGRKMFLICREELYKSNICFLDGKQHQLTARQQESIICPMQIVRSSEFVFTVAIMVTIECICNKLKIKINLLDMFCPVNQHWSPRHGACEWPDRALCPRA